jgi:hypothetical protein
MGLGAGLAMGANMINQVGGAFGGAAAAGGSAAMPPPLPTAVAFHVAINGQQAGPFDLMALQAQATSGNLKRDTLVWKAGMAQWTAAGTVPELGGLFANVPPPIPPAG